MKNIYLILFAGLIMVSILSGQTFNSEPLTHTFSIVARDSATGEMGVAVQSHWFSVGSVVSWAEAGVGAIATQSLVNVSFGPRGLELLKAGKTAQETLDELLGSDEGREFRQVAIVDSRGNVAVHTGDKCIGEAGHIKGENFSVQANMMLNETVWGEMSEAFKNARGSLAERMVAALKAAQKVGGDIRGQQSAALLVVKGESTGKEWEDVLIDLRVEDDPDAVSEIARLLKVHQAYEHMNAGDLAIEENDVDKALQEYGAAEEMFPENTEMKFWTAVSLANVGRVEDSIPIFAEVFEKDKNWKTLTQRITKNGMLTVNDQELQKILSAAETKTGKEK